MSSRRCDLIGRAAFMRLPNLFELLEGRQLLSSTLTGATTRATSQPLSVNHVRIPKSDRRKDPKGVQKGVGYTNYEIFNPTEDPNVNPFGVSSPQGRTPTQIRKSYAMDNVLFNGITGDGSGQTIAIIDAYDDPSFVSDSDPNYGISDLKRFDAQFGLVDPASFKKFNQSGGTSYPSSGVANGWAGEIALDVEWAHVMAPKATIWLVEASSSSFTNLNAAVNWAKAQPGVSAISMSYGADDFAGESSFDSTFTTPAGHQGVTFFSSSGDTGGLIEYQSSSPNVVGVGGTRLNQADSTGTYSSETAWNGSGGGISNNESKPAFQNLLTTPSSTQRTAPDVAADADPNTGVAVLDSSPNGIGSANPWFNGFVGGTSLSSPLWAGMMAVANQGRSILGLGTLDGRSQTLPRLYTLNANDFHDITSGTAGSFSAGPGYDLITGRGSPKAPQLLADLAGGASISGTAFQDNNGNGSQDSGETGQSGVTLFLDYNNNGTLDSATEPSTTTNIAGAYTFSDLIGGNTFTLREVTPSGFVRTSSSTQTATTAFGGSVTGKNFGNFPTSFNGTAFTLRLDSTGTTEQIFTGATASGSPAYSIATSALGATSLSFNGTGGNDTLNVDLTNGNPAPSGNVSFNGNGGNTLVVTGSGNADTVTLNNGNVAFASGGRVNFTGVASMNANLVGGDDTLNFNGPGTALVLNFGAGNDTFDVQTGSFAANSDIGSGTNLKVDVASGASVSFGSSQHLRELDLHNNATATLAAGGSKVLVTSDLSIDSGGKLDLNDNDLLLDYTGASPLAAIQSVIDTARNGGAWDGPGLTSASARNNAAHNTTLGVMESADYAAAHGGTFAGETPDASAVLVKYTYYGDTDFNGKVNFDDYVRTDSGFNNHRTGWTNGDFDGNGQVNFDDYVLIDLAFNTQGAAL
jgi:hypothetical protein